MIEVTEFGLYGNQPKIHSIAFDARMEIQWKRTKKKSSLKRRTSVLDVLRVNGRKDIGDFYAQVTTRRVGRRYCASAPKSPAPRWLLANGFQDYPF